MSNWISLLRTISVSDDFGEKVDIMDPFTIRIILALISKHIDQSQLKESEQVDKVWV